MRQQLCNAAGRVRTQPLEDILQVRVRLVAIQTRRAHHAHDGRSSLAGAQATGEQPVLSSKRDRAGSGLHPIVVGRQIRIVDAACERQPALEAVVDCPGRGQTIRHPSPLPGKPLLQGISHLARPLLSYSPSILRLKLGDLPFDGVELAEELQRLLADRAAVIGPEFVELALAWARQPASVMPSSKHAL